jgi:hypothetical protein
MVDVQEQSSSRGFIPGGSMRLFFTVNRLQRFQVPPSLQYVRWLPLSERPGRGAHHSDPSSAEIKNEKFHPPLLPLPYATIVCTQTSNFLLPYETVQSLQVLIITVLAYLFNFSNAMSSIPDLILVRPWLTVYNVVGHNVGYRVHST